MTTGVHIVAVGARTPLGLTAQSSAAAVRAGIGRVAEHPSLIDRMQEPVRMAWDSQLGPEVTGPSRMIELAASAIEEVGSQLVGDFQDASIPMLLALPEERPGTASHQLREVTKEVSTRTLSKVLRSAEAFPNGHAAGLLALDTAMSRIQSGQAGVCVVAGVDSYLQPDTLHWLDENRQLATSYNRAALFPGEGAGAFAVASDEAVQRHRLRSLGTVCRVGTAMEPKRIKTDTICLGEGLTAAIQKALAPLRFPEGRVNGILCDINGERYRAEEWGFALLRLSEAFVDPTDYDLPTSCWGDMGAASAPLSVVLATSAAMRRYSKGQRYLLWNSSEGGLRAAALLEFNLSKPGLER
jgi:3-oxoacyl-[acyl-carrier-protein] synthase-1